MDFFQTLRAQSLIEQYDYYSGDPANTAIFRNSLMRMPFVILKWESGYIRFDGDSLTYKDMPSGKCFLVRTTRNNNKDYDYFQQLNALSINNTKFRFATIACREIIDNGRIEYIEIIPPNNENGIVVTTDFINSPATLSFARTYIDNMSALLNAANVVATRNNSGFPAYKDLGNYATMLRDSSGYYWNPVLNWNSSKSETVTAVFDLFDGLVSNMVSNGFCTKEEKTEILNYARVSWQH